MNLPARQAEGGCDAALAQPSGGVGDGNTRGEQGGSSGFARGMSLRALLDIVGTGVLRNGLASRSGGLCSALPWAAGTCSKSLLSKVRLPGRAAPSGVGEPGGRRMHGGKSGGTRVSLDGLLQAIVGSWRGLASGMLARW